MLIGSVLYKPTWNLQYKRGKSVFYSDQKVWAVIWVKTPYFGTFTSITEISSTSFMLFIFSRFLTHANFIYIYLDVTTQTTPIFHNNLSKMYLLQVLFIDACHHQWFWSQLSWHKLTGVSNKVFVFTRFKEIPERYVASTDRSAALELLKTNPSKEAV